MPMRVIRTVKGNHSRSVNNGDKVYVFNQREVDEFKKLLIVKYVIKIKKMTQINLCHFFYFNYIFNNK